MNLVVGSGILTVEVLPIEAKKKSDLLERLYRVLVPGGMLILNGLERALFSYEDFQNLGFHPHNCTLPGYPKSFDIWSKPTASSTIEYDLSDL